MDELQNELNSKVYNALNKLTDEFFNHKDISEKDQQKMLEYSFEWFILHYFNQ